MAVLAVAVAMAAWIAGSAAYNHDSRLRQVRMAERHTFTARLLSDAQDGGDRIDGTLSSHASVHWSDARGTHAALVPVGAWQREGDTATVWLDAHGNVTTQPPTSDSAALVGVEMGFAAAAGAALIVAGRGRVFASASIVAASSSGTRSGSSWNHAGRGVALGEGNLGDRVAVAVQCPKSTPWPPRLVTVRVLPMTSVPRGRPLRARSTRCLSRAVVRLVLTPPFSSPPVRRSAPRADRPTERRTGLTRLPFPGVPTRSRAAWR